MMGAPLRDGLSSSTEPLRVSSLRASIPSAVAALLLLGCQAAPPPISHAKRNAVIADERSQLPVVTDAETGCQYIGYIGHGVTPRLDQAGKPMCGGVK